MTEQYFLNELSELKGYAQEAEDLMRRWDSVLAGTTQTFSALVNVSARRRGLELNGAGPGAPSGESAAEERLCGVSSRTERGANDAERLERYAAGLRRTVDVLGDIVEGLRACHANAMACYARRAAAIGRAATRAAAVGRTAAEPAPLDVVEAVQMALFSCEREYWAKKRLLTQGTIDYSHPEDMDALLQAWCEDTTVDRKTLDAMLRRAKGCTRTFAPD